MGQVFEGGKCEIDFWHKAISHKVCSQDWEDFYGGRGFRAGVDFPTAAFYR